MNQSNPCISVLMSVYNTEKYVGECIESILGQTFPDFEFIIINDASTDRSPDIIRSYKDKRIRLLNNRERSYPTRNKGLRVARGKYICIMDADDVSLPKRFERQVLFMEQNPEYGLAGTGFRVLGKEKDLFREGDYEKIKVQLMRTNCIVHPSMIIRHDMMKKNNLRYIRKYLYSSDYDLIARMARIFPVTNIHEVLMLHRVHEGMVSMQFRTTQIEMANKIFIEQLKYIGLNPTEEEKRLHIDLLRGYQIRYGLKSKLLRWLEKVKEANKAAKYYDEVELESFLNAFLSAQLWYNHNGVISEESSFKIIDKKEDLTDVTFVIPFRINSDRTLEIISATVEYLLQNFKTNFIILEADSEQRFFPKKTITDIRYIFVKDNNKYIHRTKWINKLLNLCGTKYIAVWDAGIMATVAQISDCTKRLRNSEADLCFPHDGKKISCGKIPGKIIIKNPEEEALQRIKGILQLDPGKYSASGVFIADRVKYLESGGENENLTGLKAENIVRTKRIEASNLKIHYSDGPLFFLQIPGENDRFDKITEKQNLKEFLTICSNN